MSREVSEHPAFHAIHDNSKRTRYIWKYQLHVPIENRVGFIGGQYCWLKFEIERDRIAIWHNAPRLSEGFEAARIQYPTLTRKRFFQVGLNIDNPDVTRMARRPCTMYYDGEQIIIPVPLSAMRVPAA